jgi:hypothetical protein
MSHYKVITGIKASYSIIPGSSAYLFAYSFTFLFPPRCLPPYRAKEVSASQWPAELCWRERKLLIDQPMSEWIKVEARRSVAPGLRGWWLGVGLTNASQKKEDKTYIGLWVVEAPKFSSYRLTDDGEVLSLTRLPAALYPQENSWYSFLLEAESNPGS